MIEFKIRDFLYPRRLIYWRWLLSRSQYYSRERLQTLQWRLFSKMLDHCFENVPHYRELFRKHGLDRADFSGLDDLSKIPILSKDYLLEHHDEFKADNFTEFHPKAIHTSGTTGSPLTVYWDSDSNVVEFTSIWRHFSWLGYRLGEPFLDIRSVILDAAEGYKWNYKCRGLEFSSDIIDESNIRRYADLLRKYRVKLWRGHPAAISAFCHILAEAGIEDVKPKYVFTASEAVLDHQRKSIEDWTGVPVCDNYGLKEHNVLITQCPQGGYHVAMEYGIVEIVKDDGTPAGPGEEGRIVATGLHNKAFPLLRYDTMDYATRSDAYCPCGRTLPLVENLTGRIDDRVLTADGRWVSGLHFAFFLPKGIRRAQLLQKEELGLDVYLVPNREFAEDTAKLLTADLKKKLGDAMEIRIHMVEEVPYRSCGKFKFVINQMDKKPPK
ncbi:MAG: phenylacetate--CoA ligase family protein [Candidatus Coatesbacteria bacterium]|nr:phenylacetate--CoA ligase family protein [Candidatus Coatesbacteria bacterium]